MKKEGEKKKKTALFFQYGSHKHLPGLCSLFLAMNIKTQQRAIDKHSQHVYTSFMTYSLPAYNAVPAFAVTDTV